MILNLVSYGSFSMFSTTFRFSIPPRPWRIVCFSISHAYVKLAFWHWWYFLARNSNTKQATDHIQLLMLLFLFTLYCLYCYHCFCWFIRTIDFNWKLLFSYFDSNITLVWWLLLLLSEDTSKQLCMHRSPPESRRGHQQRASHIVRIELMSNTWCEASVAPPY